MEPILWALAGVVLAIVLLLIAAPYLIRPSKKFRQQEAEIDRRQKELSRRNAAGCHREQPDQPVPMPWRVE